MNRNWKVGDQCLYEFKVMKVDGIEDGVVTAVKTDGYSVGFHSSHGKAAVFPVTPEGRGIAAYYEEISDRLYKSCHYLNWSAISSHLHSLFIQSMNSLGAKNHALLNDSKEQAQRFMDETFQHVEHNSRVFVSGVQLFR